MSDQRVLDELAHHLWEEREIVSYLLYRLTVTKLLLAADERRFIPDALKEVDQTIEVLRQGELARDTALRDVAGAWGMDPDRLTLPELARVAPPPYDLTFREHQRAFQDMAAEIESVARENRSLAHDQLDEVKRTIDLIAGPSVEPASPQTYDASGHVGGDAAVGGRLRKAL